MYFKINFSVSLVNKGRRLMGRYDDGIFGVLLGLAIFHYRGMCESLNIEFTIW